MEIRPVRLRDTHIMYRSRTVW